MKKAKPVVAADRDEITFAFVCKYLGNVVEYKLFRRQGVWYYGGYKPV